MNVAKFIPILIILFSISCSSQADLGATRISPADTNIPESDSTSQPTAVLELTDVSTVKPDSSSIEFFLDEDVGWILQPVDPAGTGDMEFSLKRTSDGGQTWGIVLDPVKDAGTLQSFNTTGLAFASENYGWITQDSLGKQVLVYLQETKNGGLTWNGIEMPAPPAYPDIFLNCACGLYDPDLVSTQVGSVRMTCNCLGDENYPVTNFDYSTKDGGVSWDISELP
jgi:hypothetical protein